MKANKPRKPIKPKRPKKSMKAINDEIEKALLVGWLVGSLVGETDNGYCVADNGRQKRVLVARSS